MELIEAIQERHSVRSYIDKKIEGNIEIQLKEFITDCNKESGLNMQLVLNEPKAFDSILAHYGKFSGVQNYVAIVSKKGRDNDEAIGYYGEKVVLKAQQLGLNTCWVAATFKNIKTAYRVQAGEKLQLVISLGYGENNGCSHKSKAIEDVIQTKGDLPEWFINGVKASLMAPTAINQQKFTFALDGNTVSAKALLGYRTKLDLGIIKYHFEIGVGNHRFTWR